MNGTQDTPLRLDRTPAQNFEAFNAANPQVLELLIDKAVEYALRTGKRKISATNLVNYVRWEAEIDTRDDNSARKINDHYTPFYARLLAWTADGRIDIELRDAPEPDDWAAGLGAPTSAAYQRRLAENA